MKNLKTYRDQLNREVVIPHPPKRVISLCPSLTETLVVLGLGERLVGRTKFCIHPADELATVSRVGGTKQVNMEQIHALNPDLIIGEKEENTPEMVAQLERDYPVFVTDVVDIPSALHMIQQLGLITGTEEAAEKILADIKLKWDYFPQLPRPRKVAYFIWRNPWMAVGHTNYIHSVLERLGFANVFVSVEARYPEISVTDLIRTQPEVVLLSSEPFPFQEKHIREIRELLPEAQVLLVDGEMFSWYGVRMTEAVDYFSALLPDLME